MRRVYRFGKPVRVALFSLHSLQNDHVKATRVAIVVSKKVHKSAVKRNRIRRRLYETIRHRLGDIKTPTEIVVTVYKPEIIDLSTEALEKEVNQVLKKARLLS